MVEAAGDPGSLHAGTGLGNAPESRRFGVTDMGRGANSYLSKAIEAPAFEVAVTEHGTRVEAASLLELVLLPSLWFRSGASLGLGFRNEHLVRVDCGGYGSVRKFFDLESQGSRPDGLCRTENQSCFPS